MAQYEYDNLRNKYGNFARAEKVIKIDGVDFTTNKIGAHIDNVNVSLSCGMEAATATYDICNCFCDVTGKYLSKEIEKFIQLGSCVSIALGYENSLKEVFLGVITKVVFSGSLSNKSSIKITAMDAKKVMMLGKYEKNIEASSYSQAVGKILREIPSSENLIKEKKIENTEELKKDDKKVSVIPMTEESYYDFIKKAAAKYNFEFYIVCGTVYFQKAKKDKSILIELSPDKGLTDFSVGYDFTEMRKSVEIRTTDSSKAQVVAGCKNINITIPNGKYVKKFLSDSIQVEKNIVVNSKEEAQQRAEEIAEKISYRLSSLSSSITGIPELVPGRFVKVAGLQVPEDHIFYIEQVTHSISIGSGYKTSLTGKGTGRGV